MSSAFDATLPKGLRAELAVMRARHRLLVAFSSGEHLLLVPHGSEAAAKQGAVRFAKEGYGVRWFLLRPEDEAEVLELLFKRQDAGRYSREWVVRSVS